MGFFLQMDTVGEFIFKPLLGMSCACRLIRDASENSFFAPKRIRQQYPVVTRTPGTAGVVLWRGTGLLFGVYETHPFGQFPKL